MRAVRPDGKLDLGLDPVGYRRVAPLSLRIVQALQASGGQLGLDDDSTGVEERKMTKWRNHCSQYQIGLRRPKETTNAAQLDPGL